MKDLKQMAPNRVNLTGRSAAALAAQFRTVCLNDLRAITVKNEYSRMFPLLIICLMDIASALEKGRNVVHICSKPSVNSSG
jgi:hypothetical protein